MVSPDLIAGFLCRFWYFFLFHGVTLKHKNISAISTPTTIFLSSPPGCLRPSAAAAWRKSPPQSLWCAPWSASTTWTASAAACATGSWGRATSLFWRRVSCCARSTTRGRRTYSARSARMTQTQVSPLHPVAPEWEQHGGATITWHQGVVFCKLCSITLVANTDI